eukprot:scaffold55519_cov36-Tisochrysis_lutea.AAC.1
MVWHRQKAPARAQISSLLSFLLSLMSHFPTLPLPCARTHPAFPLKLHLCRASQPPLPAKVGPPASVVQLAGHSACGGPPGVPTFSKKLATPPIVRGGVAFSTYRTREIDRARRSRANGLSPTKSHGSSCDMRRCTGREGEEREGDREAETGER